MKLETELKTRGYCIIKSACLHIDLIFYTSLSCISGVGEEPGSAERERTSRADEAGDAGYNQTKEYC